MADTDRYDTNGFHTPALDETNSNSDGLSLESDDEDDFLSADDELVEAENRALTCLRATLLVVLALSALSLGYMVHGETRHAMDEEFQQAWAETSGQVTERVPLALAEAQEALAALATDYDVYTTSTNEQWPHVTFPLFERRVAGLVDRVGAEAVMVWPVIEDAPSWGAYSVTHADWLEPGPDRPNAMVKRRLAPISDHIFNTDGAVSGPGPFLPLWQTAPISDNLAEWVNFDMLSLEKWTADLHDLLVNGSESVWSTVDDIDTDPKSPLFHPVTTFGNQTAAILALVVPWRAHLAHLVSVSGLVAVVEYSDGTMWSYRLDGPKVDYLGEGDHHEEAYTNMGVTVALASRYTLHVYPSTAMHALFTSASSVWRLVAVGVVFLVAAAVFYCYDAIVERRQKVVMNRALQSTAIVSSLFPETVRDRLFRRGSLSEPGLDDGSTIDETLPSDLAAAAASSPLLMVQPAKQRLKSFLTDQEDGTGGAMSKPIADLFPNCTVLFADISGFTAWSSLRDPAQVFVLLESVYQAFDRSARRRGVFKVETIGDSYVAVTGLPEPQDDHAVIMARFARDCRIRMTEVTRKLELTLGPDTGDLRMRFGLHSGPVTAGVLRGEKSRFQLFGDTVNTAARMESTGERDRVQISSATADLLRAAGKGHWLIERETLVHAKGKGQLQTYWLDLDNRRNRRNSTGENSRSSLESMDSNHTGQGEKSQIWGDDEEIPDAVTQRSKHQRLIDYNVDLLAGLLKKVVAQRKVLEMAGRRGSATSSAPPDLDWHEEKISEGMVLEEVTEVIRMPHFDAKAFKGHVDPETIDLGAATMAQLRRYVSVIAAMYRNNPFHNFEHASHVTMSVAKLLSRVVAPDNITFRRRSLQMNSNRSLKKQIASDLHNYTYGITSDPLTQFAIVFAALIHDVDHWGVSNGQLVKEGVHIAEKYKGKSVAEQNSVDLAWNLLMDTEEYADLQKCIFPSNAEFKRFRQVIVNVVMATDIFDKELGQLRKNRWDKAFAEKDSSAPRDEDETDRKATIVIEHIMQASDVAHTMQHWHVYQKWNRRLFDELYTAWKAGRMEVNPYTFWYEGELKFFDGYIIPLAKKLKDCGVFGVSSDECLNYAMDNRKEWEGKGQMIIEELVANYEQREREEEEVQAAAAHAASAQKKKRVRASRRRSLITTGG